jgi:NADH dehydrogenase
MSRNGKAKVAVLGGGFSGLAAVARLARSGQDVDVTLVDARAVSEFPPLYPDLISGRIRRRSMEYPLQRVRSRWGASFLQARVKSIEPGRVETDAGTLEPDYTLVALGADTNWFGNDRFRDHAIGLHSNREGLAIREAILDLCARAVQDDRESEIVIVGGGYTGFETAGHAFAVLDHLSRIHRIPLRDRIHVQIIDLAPKVLSMVGENISASATRTMVNEGARIRTELTVDEFVDPRTVRLTNGETIDNALVLWTPGVTTVQAAAGVDAEKGPRNALATDEHLHVKGADRLYAAGDCAHSISPSRGEPLRMAVQFSLLAGDCAARNILAEIRGAKRITFDPADPGYVVPLSRMGGAGDLLRIKEVYGPVPLLLHYFMCALRSWGLNRLRVAADVARLTTGPSWELPR